MNVIEAKILAPILALISSNYPPATNLRLTLHDGYFLCPSSKSNRRYAEAKRGLVMENIPFILFYKQTFPEQVDTLRHFLKLNGLTLDEDDNDQFATYMAVLCYMVAFYKRRLNYADIPSIEMKWEDIKAHVTKKTVDSMYDSLLNYLMARKGLTKKTSEKIIFGALQDPVHSIQNVLSILASLEEPFFPDSGDPKLSAYYESLRKKVTTDIAIFRSRNPLSGFVGTSMEGAVLSSLPLIKKVLEGKFGASGSIILSIDADKSVKKALSAMDQKIPDFLYIDNRLNMLVLDSKFELGFANVDQINKNTLMGVVDSIGLSEYLSARGYPCKL
jgi:hypothetical protein